MIVGMTAVNAEIPPLQAIAMSVGILAGACQPGILPAGLL